MDLKHVRAFMLAAQRGSITAAAPDLFLSAPALAQQINQLEWQVGVKLMERGPRGVTLTPAGTVFLAQAQKLMDMSDELLERTRQAAQGQATPLRMGSAFGMVPDFFPQINAACRRRLPHIHLEHVEDEPNRLLTALAEGRLHIVEYFDAPKVRRMKLDYIPLMREGRSCLMAADHPLAALPGLQPEDLEGYRLYAFQFERVPGLEKYLSEHYPAIYLDEGCTCANGYYDVLQLCGQGALCLIPPHCAHRFAPLVSRPLALPMTWTSGLICLKQRLPQVERVIQVARQLYSVAEGAPGPGTY